MPTIKTDIGRWGMIPEWLLDMDVSAQAVRLFATLAAKWADRDTNEAHPSRREIADACHVSLDTIDRAMQELLDREAITKFDRYDPRGGDQIANGYLLHFTAPQPQGSGGGAALLRLPGRTDAALPIPESDHQIVPTSHAVLLELEALTTSLVSLTLSGQQTDALAQFAEHLTVEDVPRIRDAMNDSRAWPYLKGICSRVASDRRNGLDPWREQTDGRTSAAGRGSTARGGADPRAMRSGGLGTRGARGDGSRGVPGFDSTGWAPLTSVEDIGAAFGGGAAPAAP